MTSLSTRFLGQPRLIKPTFKRVYRPYGRIFFQDSIRASRKLLPAAWTGVDGAGVRQRDAARVFVLDGWRAGLTFPTPPQPRWPRRVPPLPPARSTLRPL